MMTVDFFKIGPKLSQDAAMDAIGKLNDQARKGDLVRFLYSNGNQVRVRIVRAWLAENIVKVQVEEP